MVKKILAMLLITSLTLSGFVVSFGTSEITNYAESDEELVQAENQLNTQIDRIKEKTNKEIDIIESDKNLDKEVKKKINQEKEKLKNLKNYKDFKSNAKTNEVEKDLKDKGEFLDSSFVELCKEIEKYKEENPTVAIKEVVKHFNSLAGLKEKPKRKKLVSFSFENTVVALSYSEWTVLTAGEKLLLATNPSKAILTNSCKEKAFNFTKDKFGFNGLGDKSDGYRHGMWNALMTRDIDRSWASTYATAHEDKTQEQLNKKAVDGYYEYQHRNMDLHNNQIGRDQVAWYEVWPFLTDSTLKNRISAKLTNNSNDITWLHE